MAVAKKILGILFIILGVSGILLPVLPGWVFVFSGVYLISPHKYKDIKQYLTKLFKIREKTS